MPESIIIHCGKDASIFTNLINKRFDKASDQMWYFPLDAAIVESAYQFLASDTPIVQRMLWRSFGSSQ